MPPPQDLGSLFPKAIQGSMETNACVPIWFISGPFLQQNIYVAWAHLSVYQKEKYLIMPASGKTAFRGKEKNHSTCGETTLRS